MFTGIIQDRGVVVRVERKEGNALVRVRTSLPVEEFETGESICIDGACQTVVAKEGREFCVEATPETLGLTTLGALRAGDVVNLERALRPMDRLGGHFVQGHVDGVGVVSRVDKTGRFIVISVQVPAGLMPYLAPKGSVAIDGVSLTVNEKGRDGFDVGLIPHTAQATGLGGKKAGDRVNVETDLIAKYVESLMAPGRGREGDKLTLESLAEAGFIK